MLLYKDAHRYGGERRRNFWHNFFSAQKDLSLRMNGAKSVQMYNAAVAYCTAILIHTEVQPKSKVPLPWWCPVSHPVSSMAM